MFWPKTKLSTFSYSISLQVFTVVDMCTCMYQWLSVFHLHYFILILTKFIGAGALAYYIVWVMSQTGHQFGHQALKPSSEKYAGVVENIITTVECWKTCNSILLKDGNPSILNYVKVTLLKPESTLPTKTKLCRLKRETVEKSKSSQR